MRSLLNMIGRRENQSQDTNRPLLSVNPRQSAENASTQMRQTNAKYSGQYDSENRRHGKGVLVLRNGHTYVGQWVNGKFNGEGGHFWNKKRLFYGQWKDGKAHGEGVHKFLNGDQYSGQFKEDQMHGIGRYIYKNGTEYYGQWKDNKQNGEGLLYKQYKTYQGQWKDAKKHGKGLRNDLISEEIYKELWYNDQKIDEKRIF